MKLDSLNLLKPIEAPIIRRWANFSDEALSVLLVLIGLAIIIFAARPGHPITKAALLGWLVLP